MKYTICILIISILLLVSCNKSEQWGDYAFNMLEKQCAFGARVPGTKAHEECIDFLHSELNMYSDSVKLQKFKRKVSFDKDSIQFTNIIAYIHNNPASPTIMLCAHYDSRPFSSIDGKPTPGANDGASGVGVLLAIAKYIKEYKTDKNIIIVFFDGEDCGRDDHKEEWFIGSQYFANHYNTKIPDNTIIIDMIGDKNLNIYKEGFSDLVNKALNNKIFNIAKKLKKTTFFSHVKYYIEDDHLPLNTIGFGAIDIIDMDYEYWHTPYDTPDKCSPKSLKDVFDVLKDFLYE